MIGADSPFAQATVNADGTSPDPSKKTRRTFMKTKLISSLSLGLLAVLIPWHVNAQAQAKKPNILLIISDDTGYGDLGPYGGGVGRGMPTPNIDKMAKQGRT
jgi:hypothetical protein